MLRSWPRLLLWSHAASVILFYIVLWLRTKPDDQAHARESGRTGDGTRATARVAPTLHEGDNTRFLEESSSLVSIIVPARNEERNIRRCVTSLLEQDYDNYEVIVVDDGSTDGTEGILDEIAQRHPQGKRLYVLRLRELPEGWAGKPHALHCGVQEARGDWLLFTDADTWHAPGALRFALKEAIGGGIDLLSLGTAHELPGFWNKVMMPMAYLGISMQYPVKLINDPHSPVALANGQYILLRRAVYEITGGYARPDLRGSLVDDRDLARVVKACGFRLRLVDGRSLVCVRMYNKLGEIWQGWRKNAYLGSRGGLAFVLLELIGLPAIAIIPFLLPLVAWLMGMRGRKGSVLPAEISLAGMVELIPLLAYRFWLDKGLKVPWYYAFTHPLAGAMFEGILAESAWRVLTHKGLDWRGRQYYAR